jgi:hypothetical protein
MRTSDITSGCFLKNACIQPLSRRLAQYRIMDSRVGYTWTPTSGLKAGVPFVGVITPSANVSNSETLYDVIVVGAGYCGLTAACNAAVEGFNVLLLEGRDRIGGRSWSSNIKGYPFEMGGTWVHWGESNTWKEIVRYQMMNDVGKSFDFSHGVDHYELNVGPEGSTMSHDKEVCSQLLSHKVVYLLIHSRMHFLPQP